MKISYLVRHAFSICVTVAMLAACSGSQPPLGASGSMPQTSATAAVRTMAHQTLPTSSFKVLHSFHGDPDGESPIGALNNPGETMYGTTFYGGTQRVGTVYSVTIDGAEKVLHSFGSGSDGMYPCAGLIRVGDTLYGTTRDGGTSDKGTVYGISTKDGTERVLHSFDGSDGAYPQADLTRVGDTLYGTTRDGGTSNKGTVFSISLNGTEKVLHSFSGGSDGASPVAGLTAGYGTENRLVGTTFNGGTSDKGTVYTINIDGRERVLYSFAGGSDGAHPDAGLAYVNYRLYGTTAEGGTSDKGTVYRIDEYDTETVLHSFVGGSDGDSPVAGLIGNGPLYGTTLLGGGERCAGFGCGTVYRISTDGVETVLYSFRGSDGKKPEAGLLQSFGALYGTTSEGGTSDRGTVYALTP